MTSDLSIFAARLRDFISICADEFVPGDRDADAARQAHFDAEFNGMALMLFTLQFNHNPAYRIFCQARGIAPDSVNHWTQIPAEPASAFKELELTCLPTEARTAVFHSSGTTEQRPSRHYHGRESLEIYEASLWPWFAWNVLGDLRLTIDDLRATGPASPRLTPDPSHLTPDPSHLTPDPSRPAPRASRLIFLTPSLRLAPHSSLVYMFETVRRKLGAPDSAFVGTVGADGSWTVDIDSAVAVLRAAAGSGQPLILLGTAFSYVQLLDHLAGRDLRFTLPAGSRAMETGGYKGRSRRLPKAELHSLIRERLGIPADHILCEYGMSELSSQAYDNQVPGAGWQVSGAECQVSGEVRAFRLPPWARARVVSPENALEAAEGETGLLRVFDLANVFSVMAIQTEDLAIRRGAAFELIGRAETVEPRGCSLMSGDA